MNVPNKPGNKGNGNKKAYTFIPNFPGRARKGASAASKYKPTNNAGISKWEPRPANGYKSSWQPAAAKAWEYAKPYAREAAGHAAGYARKRVSDYLRNRGSNFGRRITGVRRKTMTEYVKADGTGASFSGFTGRHKMSVIGKRYTMDTQPHYQQYAASGRAQGSYNEQCIVVSTAMSAGSLYGLVSSVPTTVAPVSGLVTSNIYMNTCRMKMMYTNFTNTNLILWLYEIVPRRDCQLDPLASWKQGLADQDYALNTVNVYNCQPTYSPHFTHFFYILKKYKIELAPGRTHVHSSVYKVNRIFNGEYYNNTAATTTTTRPPYLQHYTRSVMAVCHGTPGDSSTGTEVALTYPAIGITQSYSYEWRYLVPIERSYYLAGTLPTVTGINVINEETAAAVAESSI